MLLFVVCTPFFFGCSLPGQSSFYQVYDSFKENVPDGTVASYMDEANYFFIYMEKDNLAKGNYLRVLFENETFKDSVELSFDPASDPFIAANCKKCPSGTYLATVTYLRHAGMYMNSVELAYHTATIQVLQLPEKK